METQSIWPLSDVTYKVEISWKKLPLHVKISYMWIISAGFSQIRFEFLDASRFIRMFLRWFCCGVWEADHAGRSHAHPHSIYLRLWAGGRNPLRLDLESTMKRDCLFKKVREGTSLSSSVAPRIKLCMEGHWQLSTGLRTYLPAMLVREIQILVLHGLRDSCST